MLLVRQVPRCRQPHPKRRARLVEYRPRRHRALVRTTATHQPRTARSVRLHDNAATRAGESARPTQLLQILQAGLFAGEPIQEFTPVAWIVFASFWRFRILKIHPVVPALVELTGYPFFIYSTLYIP